MREPVLREPGWAAANQRLTKRQRLALEVLAAHGPMTARAFARVRWAEGFTHVSSQGPHGRGFIFGAGASMKAGAMLRAFEGLGLVHSQMLFCGPGREPARVHYMLTPHGVLELAAARARAERYGKPGPKPWVRVETTRHTAREGTPAEG